MLEIGKANEVKFKVDVNGTQALPEVRLVIVTPKSELGFKAERMGDGWFSEVFIPEDVAAGDYDFRVEVVINNRLFTPIKRKVTLGSTAPMMAAESQAPHPTQKPKQTETWEGEGGALPEVPEVPQPLPAAPIPPTPKQPPKSLMKEASSQDKTPTKPTKGVTPVKPTPKAHKKVVTPLPKPHKHKTEPIRISIAEISEESNKRFDKVLKESPSYRKPGVAVTPIHINHQVPVTLKKGEVVYE